MNINFNVEHEPTFLFESYLKIKFNATLNVINQKCKKKNVEFDITVDDLNIPKTCPILGIELNYFNNQINDNSPAISRLDQSKGYVKNNIEIISMKASRIKSNASTADIIKVAEYLKLK